MFNDEFEDRYAGRYYGKYKGITSRTNDPKQRGRVMVRVPSIMGNEDLGWALPAPPSGGGVNVGDVEFPVVNDFVWVEFEGGDTSNPVWSAGPWGSQGGSSMLMEHARGEPDDMDYSVRDVTNIPPSQFAGNYADVRMIRSKSGSFLEFDNTEGEERVQLAHFAGSRIEMTEDGGLQEVVTGSVRRRAEATAYEEIGGSQYRFTGGSRETEIAGDVTDTYNKAYSRSAQEVTETGTTYGGTYGGAYDLNCGPLNIRSNSKGYLGFANQLAFMIGQNLQMTVMENMEVSASNATGLPASPSNISMNFHAYNGQLALKSTDATGLINSAEIVLQGNSAVPNKSNILLGGLSASEPMVLGNLFKSWLDSLMVALIAHTHPTGVGPSGPPIVGVPVPDFTTLSTTTQIFLSQAIMGKYI